MRKVLSSDLSKIPVYKFDTPVKLKIELGSTSMADSVEVMPGIKRIDGVTVEFVHDDYPILFDAIDAISVLAHSVKW